MLAALKSPKQSFVEPLTMIDVGSGDFRSKYYELYGLDEGFNRPIDPKRVARYGQAIDQIATSTVTLIEHRGRLYIADGQHRIAAISEYATKPVRIAARIFTLKQVQEVFGSVSSFIKGIGDVKPLGTSGLLAVYSQKSPWVRALRDLYGLELSFMTSTQRMITWASLMKAVLGYERSIEAGSFVSMMSKVDRILDVFLSADPELVSKILHWLKPWIDLNQEVRRTHKIGFLSGIIPMQTWFLVCHFNDGKKAMETLPGRIAKYDALASVASPRILEFVEGMLAVMNHGRHSNNLVELFGSVGRRTGRW